MNNYFLTVDGGTTNTRVYLVKDGTVLDSASLGVGAGATENTVYRAAIKNGIAAILEKNGVAETQVAAVIASGMITSKNGLYEVPHLVAPAGVKELRAGIHRVVLADISPIPFYFIPGVKTAGETVCTTDMMRGEETELFGLCEVRPGCLYVLPGSHSKLIHLDEEGRIAAFDTLLTGEMLASLSAHTILKDAVRFCDTFDEAALRAGYTLAREKGLAAALFKTRVYKTLFEGSELAVYSFFLGVVLSDEIALIKKAGAKEVLLGGKPQLANATACLLEDSGLCVRIADPQAAQNSTVYGALRIFGA